MFIPKTAIRSLSSLLVVAVVAIKSVVGGTSTTNRKLSKKAPPTPPLMTTCPSSMLYYPVPVDNTIGSQHIFEVFRPPSPLGNQPRLCSQSGISCIGDTVIFSGTLYSDLGLTKKVGKVVGTSKIVTIAEKGTTGAIMTASILYDTGSDINVAAYNESVRYQDFPVSGGTGLE